MTDIDTNHNADPQGAIDPMIFDIALIEADLKSEPRFQDEERPLRFTDDKGCLEVVQDGLFAKWGDSANYLYACPSGFCDVHWEMIGGIIIEGILNKHRLTARLAVDRADADQ